MRQPAPWPERLWQVLVVDEDQQVASVYRRTVAEFGLLEIAGTVRRGEDALAFLRRHSCDLMLLDLKLAGMNGLRLLQQLRSERHETEVICLTSVRSSSAVRMVMQCGAIDYLVKPFAIERLHQSLALFVDRATALRRRQLDQSAIDCACASGRVLERRLPKGLAEDRVGVVLGVLDVIRGPACAADVADKAGLSRVTARRYLEYLVTIHRASVQTSPARSGRPRKLYQLLS